MTTEIGRPFLSILAKNLGAMPVSAISLKPFEPEFLSNYIPLAASAWMVRVEPNVQEFATLMTAIRMTALKIDGKTLMPAS
jgi:hypothetical protein